ncbi:MAG: hypothetical protein A3J76_04180 [Candidatus Moranbacteria bacterium RBG_13_45_13]|nr:MAG: hypothetical protein A3J76_04180 [Candidatus Moranbacteria bacterium RBG_13_45_13]
MPRLIFKLLAVALLLCLVVLLAGCDEDDPIVTKTVQRQPLTNEEIAKYQKNKKDYDRQIMKEVVIGKLARSESLSSDETEMYNKHNKDFNAWAAKRKDKMMEQVIINKIVNGGQMSQEEITLYNKSKSWYDSEVKDKKKLLLESRILEKLVNGDPLNADEATVYTDDKKKFDEKVIGIRAGKQPQAAKTQSPPMHVDRLPVPELQKEIIPGSKAEYSEVYFEPVPRIPYLKKK